MRLIQLTDLHICAPGRPANRVVETNVLTERALRAVAALMPRPDVVVLSGDLTDHGLPEEYDVLVHLLDRYRVCPVYVIPGNHDRRDVFRRKLAHLPGVTTDPVFVQYVIEEDSRRLVMLDTVVPGEGGGGLCASRRAWLEAALSERPETPTIIVMHHPPFATGIAHMDRLRLAESEEFAGIISRHPQVLRILCGHVHRPVTTTIGHAIASIAPSVAHQVAFDLDPAGPSAFVLEPPAFQLFQWDGARQIISHMVYVESYEGPFPFLSFAEHGNPNC